MVDPLVNASFVEAKQTQDIGEIVDGFCVQLLALGVVQHVLLLATTMWLHWGYEKKQRKRCQKILCVIVVACVAIAMDVHVIVNVGRCSYDKSGDCRFAVTGTPSHSLNSAGDVVNPFHGGHVVGIRTIDTEVG